METLFKGQRISLKFDRRTHDDSGKLLAYVYLPNKTFVNGHLLKMGFALLDTSLNFSKQDSLIRFLEKGRIARAD
jgi:site-specific DNA-methyltransferase (adenine-specific)